MPKKARFLSFEKSRYINVVLSLSMSIEHVLSKLAGLRIDMVGGRHRFGGQLLNLPGLLCHQTWLGTSSNSIREVPATFDYRVQK